MYKAHPFHDESIVHYKPLDKLKKSVDEFDFGRATSTFEAIKSLKNPFVNNILRNKRNEYEDQITMNVKGLANVRRAYKVINMIDQKRESMSVNPFNGKVCRKRYMKRYYFFMCARRLAEILTTKDIHLPQFIEESLDIVSIVLRLHNPLDATRYLRYPNINQLSGDRSNLEIATGNLEIATLSEETVRYDRFDENEIIFHYVNERVWFSKDPLTLKNWGKHRYKCFGTSFGTVIGKSAYDTFICLLVNEKC